MPIILETARIEELDRIIGLESGADDYLCKPFSPRELVARIKSILRRAAPAQNGKTLADDLLLDEANWRASLLGKPLNLTQLEFRASCSNAQSLIDVVTKPANFEVSLDLVFSLICRALKRAISYKSSM